MQDKPKSIINTPEFNPGDPLHQYCWRRAGKPDLDELDADGNTWRPTITLFLQEDGETYAPAPIPSPIVEAHQDLMRSEERRRALIKELRTLAAGALTANGVANPMALGQAFGGRYGSLIRDFEDYAAGNFREAISKDPLPWLDFPQQPGNAENTKTIRDLFLDSLPITAAGKPYEPLSQAAYNNAIRELTDNESGTLSLANTRDSIVSFLNELLAPEL